MTDDADCRDTWKRDIGNVYFNDLDTASDSYRVGNFVVIGKDITTAWE